MIRGSRRGQPRNRLGWITGKTAKQKRGPFALYIASGLLNLLYRTGGSRGPRHSGLQKAVLSWKPKVNACSRPAAAHTVHTDVVCDSRGARLPGGRRCDRPAKQGNRRGKGRMRSPVFYSLNLKTSRNKQKNKKQLPVDAWTQRTEKPLARLLLFNGYTLPELKFRLPALILPAA